MKRVIISLTAIISLLLLLLSPQGAMAFPAGTYAESSVLSSGKWVKIKVSTTGLYLIPAATLQSWGFSDMSRVRVYGYGGEPISDEMSAANYVDDLPVAPMEVTDKGVVFYGRGPVKWEYSSRGGWSHSPNYYSTEGYYFVSDADTGVAATMPVTGTGATQGGATTFMELLLHENELISGGSTGHTFLGEDFQNTRSRTFAFDVPDRADDRLSVICSFATNTLGGSTKVELSLDGTTLQATSANVIEASGTDGHRHYILKSIPYRNVTHASSGDKLNVGITVTPSGTVRLSRLDYIELSYERRLRLNNGMLLFRLDSHSATLDGVGATTRLWDVTDLASPKRVEGSQQGSSMTWGTTETGVRTYVAWNPDAGFMTPEYAGTVTNQNIHADEVPDMVIITAKEWLAQAEEIAALHRESTDNPLTVAVYTQDDIFNEFSSGTPDVNAFRRMLKMHWDRGALSSTKSKLRYALLFGRGIYDHRQLSTEVKAMNRPILLQWQSVDGSHDNTSYTTEDYFAFLRDGAGGSPATDYHCIAVGRIPVTTQSEAQVTVEKLRSYISDDNKSDWKNRIILACDDEDGGEHLDQTEKVYKTMFETEAGRNKIFTKVYVDAFPLFDKVATGAHDRMFRYLNQGVMWWWYIGHANTFSWTGEGLLTMQDLDAVNFKHQPILYAATCDFLRWDLIDESGAEVMFFNPNGIIAAIAATRPVFISLNENMSLAMAASVVNGEGLTIGEILQNAKNARSGSVSDTNKLRYVLLGDPALYAADADNRMVLDAINGVAVDKEAQPTIKARENVLLEGRVVDGSGNIVADFDGTLVPTLYDAEYSTTSLAHGKGEAITFEEQGDRLYIGKEQVKEGKFSFTLAMPSEISYNFRPAALNLYAWSENGTDASGVNRDFYVYGYSEDATTDTEPPVIELFALNSSAFSDGQTVNEAPTVIGRVRDDIGINISGAGIGHQMSLLLDGSTSYSDLTQYYEPGDEGPLSGSFSYPLSGLSEGEHELRLRVWDTSNNYAESSISFNVKKGTLPEIINLYADANPATTGVNFYVEHNRPTTRTDVTVAVYDLMGRMVWSDRRTDRNDTAGMPFAWDLTDNAGRRVSRGIYVYRATIDGDGELIQSKAKKIAVAAQ